MARRQSQEKDTSSLSPLTTSEVNEVLEDVKGFTRDRAGVEEFLERAKITTKALNELKSSFQLQVEKSRKFGPLGTANNLSPVESARFLSEDQMTKIFDSFMQQKLDAAESIKLSAQRDALQVNAVVEALQQNINQLMVDPSVPREALERLALSLDQAVAAASTLPPKIVNHQPGSF